MHKTVDIELGANILAANQRIAEDNRKLLKEKGIKAFDVMGSIGAGKTLLIEAVIDKLKKKGVRAAAIAGDVSGNDDYMRFISHDIQAVNTNTGKECHLDAHLVDHALEELKLDEIDILFIENVGNLVCPADFPLGTDKRIVVVSVTEGDDMVRKHPVIFGLADIVVLNKIDLAKVIEVDPEIILNDLKKIKPGAKVFLTDAKHDKGIEELMSELGI
jgi:hydrogenase nickel incorporation protein HypB